MIRMAIFASGNGTNFQNLAEKIADRTIPVELALLFSDHHDAYVLERAKKIKVATISLELKDFSSKKTYETAILKHLRAERVDLIVLAGYMKIIGSTLLTNFPQRIINIHPAFLPEFPGAHGIADAFNAPDVTESGVTIHYVDSGIDTGKIIAQEKVPIFPTDTMESFEERIHEKEYELYPRVLQQVVERMDHEKSLNQCH